jgi:hypothetical protein
MISQSGAAPFPGHQVVTATAAAQAVRLAPGEGAGPQGGVLVPRMRSPTLSSAPGVSKRDVMAGGAIDRVGSFAEEVRQGCLQPSRSVVDRTGAGLIPRC